MTMRGQTQTLLGTFYDAPGGAPADVTSLTLTLILSGSTVYGPFTTPAVAHDAVGRYRYDWTVPDDAPLGVYTAEWSAVLPDETGPSVGYETFTVEASTLPPDPDLPTTCWPVDTTVVPDWDALTDPDVPEDPDTNPPIYSADTKARAIALAGQSMRLLTGFRVGGCPITVRPCRRDCNTSSWGIYPVRGYSGSTPWWPVNLGGQWLNVACGCTTGCSCSRLSEVRLSGAASAVTEVKVDGVVLDPSAYRLDPGGRLVRTDGEGWPLCQDLNAPDTEPGTWSVTYSPGAAVDGLGAAAAGLLAGEYAKALTDGECGLPTTVTQVVRLGVTMTLAPGSFPGGKTGIRVVDDYITFYNPTGYLGVPSALVNIDALPPRPVGPQG